MFPDVPYPRSVDSFNIDSALGTRFLGVRYTFLRNKIYDLIRTDDNWTLTIFRLATDAFGDMS